MEMLSQEMVVQYHVILNRRYYFHYDDNAVSNHILQFNQVNICLYDGQEHREQLQRDRAIHNK